MITTRTTALIAAMSLLGTVAPAAFAQNTSVNTDDDLVLQANEIKQKQEAANLAAAGNVDGDDNIVAGNNAVALSFQDQDADADNDVDDNDDFTTTQVDVCALVLVGIIC
ncbi:MAG TPA: hypothetical protein VJ695_04980 [Nitrososphaera sp.]|nr:hypothetical protein [Nitrososphaera sp.]